MVSRMARDDARETSPEQIGRARQVHPEGRQHQHSRRADIAAEYKWFIFFGDKCGRNWTQNIQRVLKYM